MTSMKTLNRRTQKLPYSLIPYTACRTSYEDMPAIDGKKFSLIHLRQL